MLNLILVIIGTAIGILASMVGLGGGFLITPLLILIFKLQPKNAIAISLFAMSGTTISATISYIRQKRVDFKLGLLYDLLDIPGIILGAYLTTILTSDVLKIICATFIIFVSLILMKKNKEENIIKNPLQNKGWQRKIIDSTGKKFEYIVKNISFALISSFLGGLITGLVGLGGGITDVSTMIFLGVPVHIAVATSEFAMALTNSAGVIAHGFLRNILWEYAIPLALGTIIGAQIGSLLAKKTKGKFLKRIIAFIAFIIGIRLIFSVP
ncbi:hypothetical protein AMJ49_01120 [Parcubacteria bacterium DG_74_2]|nr:MAG: hypothetical protein AMJ49_01120 [Parcubacteria bacterium DG_74_2]